MRTSLAVAATALLACSGAFGARDITIITSVGIHEGWSIGPPANRQVLGIAVEEDRDLYFVGGVVSAGVWKIDLRTHQRSLAFCYPLKTGSIDGEGGNPADDLGDGNPATQCTLRDASDILRASDGSFFISDQGNYRVRRIDAATGIIDTFAGNGVPGSAGDGGPATAASLVPRGLAMNSGGDLFITDLASNTVRRVDALTGTISTYAGNGIQGFGGDGGPAVAASLSIPTRLAVDGDGNLLIADRFNHRIRRVDAATGVIDTVAGDGSDTYTGECTHALSTGIVLPSGVAVDPDGNIYYSDYGDHRIRRVDAATGLVTTVAGTGIQSFSVDGRGGDQSDELGDHRPAVDATLNRPDDLELVSGGVLYVADTLNERARRIDLRADTSAFDPVLIADPWELFPADGRLVDVQVTSASGACGSGPALLVSAESGDPDHRAGSRRGDVRGAEPGTADDLLQLRAERSGHGRERRYVLTYEYLDPSGGFILKSTEVTVPARGRSRGMPVEKRELTSRR